MSDNDDRVCLCVIYCGCVREGKETITLKLIYRLIYIESVHFIKE